MTDQERYFEINWTQPWWDEYLVEIIKIILRKTWWKRFLLSKWTYFYPLSYILKLTLSTAPFASAYKHVLNPHNSESNFSGLSFPLDAILFHFPFPFITTLQQVLQSKP